MKTVMYRMTLQSSVMSISMQREMHLLTSLKVALPPKVCTPVKLGAPLKT